MNSKICYIFTAVLAGFAVSASSAWAVGVSVTPVRLDLSANVYSAVSRELLVGNNGAQPAAYQVSPDGWKRSVSIRPAEFILEPGGSQLVTVTIRPVWPLPVKTNISVVARPLSQGGLTAAGGVKVPLSVSVFPSWWLILLAGLAVCLAGFFGVKLRLALKSKKTYE